MNGRSPAAYGLTPSNQWLPKRTSVSRPVSTLNRRTPGQKRCGCSASRPGTAALVPRQRRRRAAAADRQGHVDRVPRHPGYRRPAARGPAVARLVGLEPRASRFSCPRRAQLSATQTCRSADLRRPGDGVRRLTRFRRSGRRDSRSAPGGLAGYLGPGASYVTLRRRSASSARRLRRYRCQRIARRLNIAPSCRWRTPAWLRRTAQRLGCRRPSLRQDPLRAGPGTRRGWLSAAAQHALGPRTDVLTTTPPGCRSAFEEHDGLASLRAINFSGDIAGLPR